MKKVLLLVFAGLLVLAVLGGCTTQADNYSAVQNSYQYTPPPQIQSGNVVAPQAQSYPGCGI